MMPSDPSSPPPASTTPPVKTGTTELRHVTLDDVDTAAHGKLSFPREPHSSDSDSSSSNSRSEGDHHHTKRRRILFPDEEEDCNDADSGGDGDGVDAKLPATQPFRYSCQTTSCGEQASDNDDDDDDALPKVSVFVRDMGDNSMTTLVEKKPSPYHHSSKSDTTTSTPPQVYTIGRNPNSSLQCRDGSIGRHHADLLHDRRLGCFRLKANNDCWLFQEGEWRILTAGSTSTILDVGQAFRLLPKDKNAPRTGVEFCFGLMENPRHEPELTGSASFDAEYLKLLRLIHRHGLPQTNKKGSNRTLRDPFTLRINLSSPTDDTTSLLLPITTLRKIFPQAALLEAVWYLRGENHIHFLRQHQQKFWDRQARDDGWLGYNYGLLTTYPEEPRNGCCFINSEPKSTFSRTPINQVEENVLKPLCEGRSSRNMVCTLCKPGEATLQQACTSSIQFSVSGATNDILDLTVTQRSSDVILGLPHDVIVWSVILHLVRREVHLRTGRVLRSGQVNFCISGGGAHVYDLNAADMELLLQREPKQVVLDHPPHLVIDESCQSQGMMDLARSYGENGVAKLRAASYTKDCYHPYMKIEQAI